MVCCKIVGWVWFSVFCLCGGVSNNNWGFVGISSIIILFWMVFCIFKFSFWLFFLFVRKGVSGVLVSYFFYVVCIGLVYINGKC